MRHTLRLQITFGLALALTSGCISVKLSTDSSAKRAEGVTYKDPASPFAKEDRTDVDAAWKNTQNGNMLSFLTECQAASDPTLDTIVQGTLRGLNELTIENSDKTSFQGREARRVLALGKVDGVQSKIDLLTFKRNNCIYILSYFGVAKSFAQDHSHFDRFVQGFRAP